MSKNKEDQGVSFGEVQELDMFGLPQTPLEEPKNTEAAPSFGKAPETPTEEVKEEVKEADDQIGSLLFPEGAEREVDIETLIGDKPKKETDYDKIAATLVESGIWQEFQLEDVDSLDEESFNALKQMQAEKHKASILEETVGTLDVTEKEFIDFKKSGGDLKAYIDTFKFQEEAEKLDIDSDQGKMNAVYSYYKNVKGLGDAEARLLVDTSIKDLTIGNKAKEAKEHIEGVARERHEAVKRTEKERVDAINSERAQYQQDLKKHIETAGAKGKKIETILKDFTEPISKNGLTQIDEAYLNLKNNPEQAFELWSFLNNREEYLKNLTQTVVNDKNLSTFKGITFNKQTNTTALDKEKASPKGVRLI